MFICIVTELGQRKTSPSPQKRSKLTPADSMLRSSTIEPRRLNGERGHHENQ